MKDEDIQWHQPYIPPTLASKRGLIDDAFLQDEVMKIIAENNILSMGLKNNYTDIRLLLERYLIPIAGLRQIFKDKTDPPLTAMQYQELQGFNAIAMETMLAKQVRYSVMQNAATMAHGKYGLKAVELVLKYGK